MTPNKTLTFCPASTLHEIASQPKPNIYEHVACVERVNDVARMHIIRTISANRTLAVRSHRRDCALRSMRELGSKRVDCDQEP